MPIILLLVTNSSEQKVADGPQTRGDVLRKGQGGGTAGVLIMVVKGGEPLGSQAGKLGKVGVGMAGDVQV